MEVSLFLPRVAPDGRSSYNQLMTGATNDRGEYRLFPVQPGKYYLSAGPPTRSIPTVQASTPINNPKNKYPRLFHPGVPEVSAAAAIDVFSGGELSGLDFRMTEQPTFRIKGRVIDTVTGQQLPRDVSISIAVRNSNVNVGGFATTAVLDPRDGSFDLQYIAPGSYLIRALSRPPLRGGTARPTGAAEIAAAAVDVLNRDVDDVVVAFRPLLSLTGRVRMENGAPPPADIRVNVFLRSSMPPMTNVPRLQWNSDGTFRIDGIEPGEYLVSISPMRGNGGAATGVSVREARSGPVNLLKEPLLLTDPRPDEIVVTLSTTGR
jgi:hypothetical protein